MDVPEHTGPDVSSTQLGTEEVVHEHVNHYFISNFLWVLLCVATLGFPQKYSEQLELFEKLIPSGPAWTSPKTFSNRGPVDGTNPNQQTIRQKQQVSWLYARENEVLTA